MKTFVFNFLKILAVIPALLLLQSCSSQIPKTVEIKTDSVVFQDWNAVQEYFDRIAYFKKTLGYPSSPSEFANMSETQAQTLGQALQQMTRGFTVKLAEEGKVVSIPSETQIAITGYYDQKGNKIEPVWNDEQKMAYTPSGDFVFVSGEWQGTNIITLLQ